MSSAQQRQQQRGPAWLDGYVTAEEKLKAFRADHPSARILTQRLEGEPLTFRAEIYLDGNETTIPNATGHADVNGGSGNRKQSPTEKTETAAISRALTVMGYGGEEEEQRQETQRAPQTVPPTQVRTAPGVPPVKAVGAESSTELSMQILEAADALGYDPVKVKKWVNQKYEITNGLEGLTEQDKREVLKIFREQSPKVKRA